MDRDLDDVLTTLTVRQPVVRGGQVDATSARALATWCGGWATDDLLWNERMHCYMYPGDHPEYPGAMFSTWGTEPVPGAVMLPYGVIAKPGDWIVEDQDRIVWLRAEEVARNFDTKETRACD